VSKAVAVILDDDNWFWAYDVSLAVVAVEVLRLVDAGASTREPGLEDLVDRLKAPVLVSGTLGLHLVDLTDAQREQLLALLTEASRRLRARPSVPAAEVMEQAERYVAGVEPYLLRGASFIDTYPVADLADAVIGLIRGELPPPPPRTTAWLYGWDDSPSAL
jgi:hypothetical protein